MSGRPIGDAPAEIAERTPGQTGGRKASGALEAFAGDLLRQAFA